MLRDVVIPAGPDRQDTLRWALRTIWANYTHRRVFVFGVAPPWLSDRVVAVPTDQRPDDRLGNLRRQVEAVLSHPDVADEVVWWDDDVYLLEAVDEVPLMDKGSLRDWLAARSSPRYGASDYTRVHERCLELLTGWGYTDGRMPAHVPIPVSRPVLSSIMERAWAEGWPDGVWRPLYLTASGFPTETIEDPKRHESSRWWSSEGRQWHGLRGRRLRELYWRPSPYEVVASDG